MGQQPVIYHYACYPPSLLPQGGGKNCILLTKLLGGGARNFIFLITDMLEINSFGGQSKGILNSRLILEIWGFFCYHNLKKKKRKILLNCKLMPDVL